MMRITGPVHIVGIGGKHMSAIASLLLDRGVAVSGSDRRPTEVTDALAARGARIFAGHNAANVGDAAMLVFTAAVFDDNPEVAEGRRRGIPVLSRGQMVAALMEGKRVVAVAGAHGKTTTSTLIAWVLREAGRDPMYILGDDSVDLGGGAAWGSSDICVVEADEFRGAFLEYRPSIAVVTNVEADHLDFYGTPENYRQAFVAFAGRIVAGGLLVACGDDDGARAVAATQQALGNRTVLYGIETPAGLTASDVRMGEAGAHFVVERDGTVLGPMRVNLPARHLVLNALGATAALLDLDVPFETIASAVERFHGAKRRFEAHGEVRGVLVMDDFAHHPTECRATIATARRRFPERRLVVIHQPYTYSRLQYLWDEWLTCFTGVDQLIILETDAAREVPGDGPMAVDLARALGAPYARDHAEAARLAAELAREGDVVFTMGCGDVYRTCPLLLEALR